MKKLWWLIVPLLACAVLAGCSSGTGSPRAGAAGSPDSAPGPSTTGTSEPAAAPSAFPVTVKSALGSATIAKRPERVVTMGWGSQDVALALGVVPVAMEDFSSDCGCHGGILPWDAAKLAALGGQQPTLINTSDSVPFERIAALHPDVILAVDSGVTADQYADLSKIAPTVAYPGKPWLTSWQDELTIVGQALGESAKAQALLSSTNQLIATAKADHPEFAGKTIAFGAATATSSYYVYLQSDARVQLLHELGFTVSPSLPTTAPSFAAQLSLERLDSIKADVLVAWYLSPSVKKQLEANPLFQRMQPVARHGYVPLTDPPMVYATSAVSVLSLPWMLNRYLPLLSAAAKGQGA